MPTQTPDKYRVRHNEWGDPGWFIPAAKAPSPSVIRPIALFVGGMALALAVLLVSFYATTIVQQWLPWLQ